MIDQLDNNQNCKQEDNKRTQDNQTEQKEEKLSSSEDVSKLNSSKAQSSLEDNRHKIFPSDEKSSPSNLIELRPHFAIIKHHLNDTPKTNKAVPAPDWFFNIPTTRSPFPDINGVITRDCDT